MKSLTFVFRIVLVLFLAQSCKSSALKTKNLRPRETDIMVYQNGVETVVREVSETVKIDRKPFSIRFFNKLSDSPNGIFHAARIAAFSHDSLVTTVTFGMSEQDFSFLTPGSGIASSRSGRYDYLFLDLKGHHYLFKDATSQRLNRIADSSRTPKLEFEISGLHYKDQKINIEATQLDQLYLVCFIDRNLNGIIEESELHKLTLDLR
ncbi:hypothetical protein [Winogradskyella rapida]|uniref:EF-hand domain-containing protein n=1 Tax=Winogradskyella rapida TaxID=549701 RepID=A0ABW3KVF2_9FLAO